MGDCEFVAVAPTCTVWMNLQVFCSTSGHVSSPQRCPNHCGGPILDRRNPEQL
jgi:hypothetical protein